MKKESLEKARNIVITSINGSLFNEIDEVELSINLYHFLNPDQYEENIEVLEQHRINKQKRK